MRSWYALFSLFTALACWLTFTTSYANAKCEDSAADLGSQTQDLFTAGCTTFCKKFFRNDSAPATRLFEKSCRDSAAAAHHSYSLADLGRDARHGVEDWKSCAPEAVKKAAFGVWDLVTTGLPQLARTVSGAGRTSRPESTSASPSANGEKPLPKDLSECMDVSEDRLRCLSDLQQIAVGSTCMGEEFNKRFHQILLDSCSDGLSLFVGGATTKVAGAVGPEVVALGAAEAGEATAKATSLASKSATGEKELAAGVPELKGTSAPGAEVPKTPEVHAFVDRLKESVFADETQNQKFIQTAEAAGMNANRTRFFDVENSVMKKLNDVTNDKNLVTSLTNLQKQTFLKNLDEVKARFPEAKFEFYSDFKSIKVSVSTTGEISAARNAELLKEFNSAYQKTNREFSAKVKELGVSVPSAGEPEGWFRAGFGRSVDEAALAARRARTVEGEARTLDFASAEVKNKMTERLAEVEKDREALVGSPAMAKLVERDARGVMIPREDVFDLARKFDSPDKLLTAVNKRYPNAGFSIDDATRLSRYSKGVDEFSPTILIAKRTTVNLDRAYQGGASADFLGMGSANLKGTASGIARRSTLEDALAGARKGEQAVTRTFKYRMEQFKRVVGGDVVCSGDDCIRTASRALSDAEKLRMLDRLANNPHTRSVRMSFVGPGVEQESRMQLATHGESIEKALRKELEGHVSFEKLQEMTFGFDMKTVKLGSGKVDLIIGRKGQQRFSATERREFQNAFSRALNSVNKETLEYERGEALTARKSITFVAGPGILGVLAPATHSEVPAPSP